MSETRRGEMRWFEGSEGGSEAQLLLSQEFRLTLPTCLPSSHLMTSVGEASGQVSM